MLILTIIIRTWRKEKRLLKQLRIEQNDREGKMRKIKEQLTQMIVCIRQPLAYHLRKSPQLTFTVRVQF